MRIRSTKLCYCSVPRCNEQWVVGMMQRELNSSHMLYLLIGLAFVIVSWNILLCCISWRCMKVTPNTFTLMRCTSSSTQKCSLILAILKVFISACLLLSSWIPAIVNCRNRDVQHHIAELIFLPQIFIRASPLSLFFIPFGFLPLIHISALLFCMLVTISEESSRVHAIKTFMMYCDTVFAIIYYLSAYFMGKAVNTFVESFQFECTVKMKQWMVAMRFAYSIGALCTITVLLLIITRLTGPSDKKDDPLMNKDVESLEQESSVSMSTAHSVPLQVNRSTIELSPKPFVVNMSSNGVLNLRNAYSNQWVAIRILSNNSALNIHPTKFLLPPGRVSATDVTMTNNVMKEEPSSRLLVQWYTVGSHCPARNVNTLWTRPYYVSRDQWHYKVISVYFTST
uniref:G_PROTEIN_RECEP_F1_2 domain-containing protein n=1 Tax=Elaeophora elaphi TaxID=1147741 RepID=A0A0R3RWU2_9BILA